mgnify:CR=1 FL=1
MSRNYGLGTRDMSSAGRIALDQADAAIGPAVDDHVIARIDGDMDDSGLEQRAIFAGVVILIMTGALLALAYPDRIGRRRAAAAGRYLLSGGRGAALPEGDPMANEEFLVVADLDGSAQDSRIFLAAPITVGEIEDLYADRIVAETERLLDDADAYAAMARAHNPYGDGQSCRRIVRTILENLK